MLPEPRREVQVLLHDLEVPKRIPPTRSLLRALEENGDGLDYARQVVVVTKAKAAQQSVVPLYVVQRSRLKANFHPLAAIERIADCLDDRSSNLGVGGFIAHLTSLAEISPRKRGGFGVAQTPTSYCRSSRAALVTTRKQVSHESIKSTHRVRRP